MFFVKDASKRLGFRNNFVVYEMDPARLVLSGQTAFRAGIDIVGNIKGDVLIFSCS